MTREFTERLRHLAKTTAFSEVKKKIDAYFTLHDEVDVSNESNAAFLVDQIKPFMTKDKSIYAFCKAFENRQALATLGVTAALTQIQQTKAYAVNHKIKDRIDELVSMKAAGAPEIRIYESYKNEVQELVLDNFFDKYMSDVDAKYKQFRAYAFVEETLEALSKDPNPELLDSVFAHLESAMSLPASQVPFYLIKALTPERHLAPNIIGQLITKLKGIDPMTQRNTMSQIRYVGNAGIYESVVAPVKYGEKSDTIMLGKRLFNISEAAVEEPEEGTVDESFVEICRAFAHTNISESGSLSVTDDQNNQIEVDEDEEGKAKLTVNGVHSVAVDEAKGWKTELLGMQIHPGMIAVIEKITESISAIHSMDNIMSLSSQSGTGYTMHLIKQGKANHLIITDPQTGECSIQNNVPVKEAIEAAMSAFGADVSKFFNEEKVNENADAGKEKELMDQLAQVDASIAEIQAQPENVQKESEVVELMKQLTEQKEKLTAELEQLQGSMQVAQ